MMPNLAKWNTDLVNENSHFNVNQQNLDDQHHVLDHSQCQFSQRSWILKLDTDSLPVLYIHSRSMTQRSHHRLVNESAPVHLISVSVQSTHFGWCHSSQPWHWVTEQRKGWRQTQWSLTHRFSVTTWLKYSVLHILRSITL